MGFEVSSRFANDARKAAANLEKSGRHAVEAGAAKMTARLRAAGAAHGPLHGKGGKPIRLSARYDVKTVAGEGVAYVKPRPAGAWQIAETGAAPHLIGLGRTGRKGRAVIYLKGKGYAHPVRGPVVGHARGHRTWTTARQRAEPEAMKAMQKAPLDAVAHLFGR